ncbi:uncharacterized protein LOC131891288 [Tigriopus californicus]|uniref:uncharacterized protein LOC131891288 n=1 Tax=Tigriopus californicus TaxID=6832 RepID=UPI0027D9DF3A|nr:uncharacterized protein LOC131891288 [Tigriopus californicus]
MTSHPITELILHSKTKRFIATIDIQKMFFSVRLSKESDRDMLSPFLAIWCLKETAKMWQTKYPEAAQIILTKTYMDDILILANSPEDMKVLVAQILLILESGGFYGHKLSANDPSLLDDLDPNRVEQSPTTSLLGLMLDHKTDEFKFDLDDKFKQFDEEADVITRRNVVSLASQVFDTQGYVAPYVMRYKSILPLLWHNNNGWDENLLAKQTNDPITGKKPDEIAERAVILFKEWISDANTVGMGVAAYLISEVGNGVLDSQLDFAKSSLMPKNLRKGAEAKDALTIARAELIGIVMAVNVGRYLQNAYKSLINNEQLEYFTDSLLNLQRIQRGTGQCKVWEDRRIRKILDGAPIEKFHFCPGKMNPADLPSRGCTLQELQSQFKFWDQGSQSNV